MTPAAIKKLQGNSLPEPKGTPAKIENVLVLRKNEINCLDKYRAAADDASKPLVHLASPICGPQ